MAESLNMADTERSLNFKDGGKFKYGGNFLIYKMAVF
jgi:hypothetical protein